MPPSNVLIISMRNADCSKGAPAAFRVADDTLCPVVPTAHGMLMYSQVVPFVAHRLHFAKRWSQRRFCFAHA